MTNRVRIIIVLIAVLLIGCLLGVAGLHLWEERLSGSGGLGLLTRENGHSNKLIGLLQLTPEQQTQYKTILQDTRREVEANRAEMQRKLVGIRDQANVRIVSILNEEQKKKFEQYLKDAGPRRDSPGRHGGQNGHGHQP
jgi:Spy/CpxP family protein refolding chaperone